MKWFDVELRVQPLPKRTFPQLLGKRPRGQNIYPVLGTPRPWLETDDDTSPHLGVVFHQAAQSLEMA